MKSTSIFTQYKRCIQSRLRLSIAGKQNQTSAPQHVAPQHVAPQSELRKRDAFGVGDVVDEHGERYRFIILLGLLGDANTGRISCFLLSGQSNFRLGYCWFGVLQHVHSTVHLSESDHTDRCAGDPGFSRGKHGFERITITV